MISLLHEAGPYMVGFGCFHNGDYGNAFRSQMASRASVRNVEIESDALVGIILHYSTGNDQIISSLGNLISEMKPSALFSFFHEKTKRIVCLTPLLCSYMYFRPFDSEFVGNTVWLIRTLFYSQIAAIVQVLDKVHTYNLRCYKELWSRAKTVKS